MSPTLTTLIVFGCAFGGAMLGMWLGRVLPEHHLTTETRSVISFGVGLIGTMSALLLSLLIASAKTSFDARKGELTQMAANALLLDRALAHYGPETRDIRSGLRVTVERLIDQLWTKNATFEASNYRIGGEVLFDQIQALSPHSDAQRALQTTAESLVISFGQTRLLLFEQNETSISTPFLVVVVFWLSTLLVAFGLFAPRNLTAVASLLVVSFSAALALFLILELDHPFSGLIQIPSAPLRNTLAMVGQ